MENLSDQHWHALQCLSCHAPLAPNYNGDLFFQNVPKKFTMAKRSFLFIICITYNIYSKFKVNYFLIDLMWENNFVINMSWFAPHKMAFLFQWEHWKVQNILTWQMVGVFDNYSSIIPLSGFFFSTLGLGPGPLELGKLATKLEFWETSQFNN